MPLKRMKLVLMAVGMGLLMALVALTPQQKPTVSQPTPAPPAEQLNATYAPAPVSGAPVASQGGSRGFVIAGANCTLCVTKRQNGNAGTWHATHSTPQIGDTMIFRPGEEGAGPVGHVAEVVGVFGNMIAVKHCHWGSNQTLFFSTGKFY